MRLPATLLAAPLAAAGFALAAPAEAASGCEAIRGDAALFEAEAVAFAEALPAARCTTTWQRSMRALRFAKVADGVTLREETWGFAAGETASDCAPDHFAVRCSNRYRCDGGEAVATVATECEPAPSR